MLKRSEADLPGKRERIAAEGRGMQLLVCSAVCAVQGEMMAAFSRSGTETEGLIICVRMNEFKALQKIEDAVDRHSIDRPAAGRNPQADCRSGEGTARFLECSKHHASRLRIAVAPGFEIGECGLGGHTQGE